MSTRADHRKRLAADPDISKGTALVMAALLLALLCLFVWGGVEAFKP